MAIQKREVEYAKELDDVAALVVSVVKDAKAGKPAAEIASGSVTKLIDALSGLDQVKGELEASRKVVLQTVLYRAGEIADAVIG